MTKKRTGDPWLPSAEYGHRLPPLSVNLIVRDMERSLAFYREVLAVTVHYADPDFAALEALGVEFMLHADHAYDGMPWHPRLASEPRGLGVELRLFGLDPDEVQSRAEAAGAEVVIPTRDMGHGWREVLVADPDGYVWAVGITIP